MFRLLNRLSNGLRDYMTSEKKQMVNGLPFNPVDPELRALRKRAREICSRYQAQPSTGHMKQVLSLFDRRGEHCYVEPGVRLDYGSQMQVGDRFYANFNCVFLDASWITCGDNVMLGPGVHIYTVTHPLDVEQRRTGVEQAKPVSIGNDVWIGGGSIILPGVEIGNGAVVAAGSIVNQNVPANTLVAGNPASMIREL